MVEEFLPIFEDFGTIDCEYFLQNDTLEVTHVSVFCFLTVKISEVFRELGFCFMQRLVWTSAIFLPEMFS